MLFFIYIANQNDGAVSVFKYISCYSLSVTPATEEGENNKFKYISCYSLSNDVARKATVKYNLNTSHVILYLAVIVTLPSAFGNLNTSHVILYQRISYLYCGYPVI